MPSFLDFSKENVRSALAFNGVPTTYNMLITENCLWDLTFTTLWANSADVNFFFFPPPAYPPLRNLTWHFMQIIAIWDNLHKK